MDWVTRFERAFAYFEENLAGEIDWAEMGRRALCPAAQFARIFALMTEMPLSEYLRRRRLTRAAQDLAGGDRVLDVALRYGYASPTAFGRAFAQFHDITPSQARHPGVALKSFGPLSFQLTIQGGIALEYRIEKKPALRMAGYYEDISMTDGNNFVRIPQMWGEMTRERAQALVACTDGMYQNAMFGVIEMVADREETLRYWVAVATEKTDLPEWMETIEVAEATYAVFPTRLSELQNTTRQIFAQWLPGSAYEHAMGPEIEYYPAGEKMGDSGAYQTEIWIPVTPKA